MIRKEEKKNMQKTTQEYEKQCENDAQIDKCLKIRSKNTAKSENKNMRKFEKKKRTNEEIMKF